MISGTALGVIFAAANRTVPIQCVSKAWRGVPRDPTVSFQLLLLVCITDTFCIIEQARDLVNKAIKSHINCILIKYLSRQSTMSFCY